MATTLNLNEATEVLVSFDQWRMGVSETYYGALSRDPGCEGRRAAGHPARSRIREAARDSLASTLPIV